MKYKYNDICSLECSKHCSLCYNETECYECTHGYFLNEGQECESKFDEHNMVKWN